MNFRKYALSFLTWLFLITSQSNIYSEIRYVSPNGTSIPPFTSWLTASDSIQKCINISSSGDTIYVANGVYKETVRMIVGLSLIGAGLDSCIIDTRALATVSDFYAVVFEDSCYLSGFTVTVSNQNWGIAILSTGQSNNTKEGIIELNRFMDTRYGIYIDQTKIIAQNNIIQSAERGVVLGGFNSNSIPIIRYNVMIDIINYGIQVTVGGSPIIHNNIITLINDNFSKGYVGGGSNFVQMYNNLVICNTCDIAYILTLLPHLFVNNAAIGYSNEGLRFGDQNIVKNNLFISGRVGMRRYQGTSVSQYNNSWNNDQNYSYTPDSTNLSVNPMITSEDSGNFYLQMFSEMIDAGDPTILDKDSSRSDIGPFGGPSGETYKYQDLPPRPPVIIQAQLFEKKIYLIWKQNTETDFSNYLLYRDTVADFTSDSTNLILSDTINTFVDSTFPKTANRIYYKLRSIDNQGNLSNAGEEIGVIINTITGTSETITNFQLFQNYPNPFNPGTIIPYRLKERGYVKLMIYDIKGELVRVLVNQEQEAGYYEVEFNSEKGLENSGLAERLASSVYIYHLQIKSDGNIPIYTESKKMMLIR